MGASAGREARAADHGRPATAPPPSARRPTGLPTTAPFGPPPPAERPARPLRPGCPARHCWVTAPVDASATRPGLLLEWRRVGPGGWEGRVVYAAELRPGRWATVEEWVPAELLSAR